MGGPHRQKSTKLDEMEERRGGEGDRPSMLLTNAVWQSEFGPSVVLLQILYPVWGPRPPGTAGKGLQRVRQRCQGEIYVLECRRT